jgi:hypothetical protein
MNCSGDPFLFFIILFGQFSRFFIKRFHSQNSGPFLVWRNSKFSKDWVLLLKDPQGVDNLSIVFQTMKNLEQKNDPYDVIWVEMDYIENAR